MSQTQQKKLIDGDHFIDMVYQRAITVVDEFITHLIYIGVGEINLLNPGSVGAL